MDTDGMGLLLPPVLCTRCPGETRLDTMSR